ncbi:hypothetical protein M7I_5124 [Glarea lozoyensis 74030]|uniref:Alpha/beta-Hydrolase n=1 Tax=Glarea lozoyensis (strain ATCC 74030 / MF5533) TaxID=1104152 RepID=H0ER13_GLAL7|nr:hypothetical protein M7I_5124 [Glarea lozoyensis 74030]
MNTKQFLFTSESTRRAQVRTVITALLSEPQMSLMVHALSNGGAKRLYAIRLPRWFWYELVWGPHDGAHNTAYLNKNCVKAFVYSKEDEAIDWRNVEAHAKETEERGFRVERKLIEGAAHVQLFKGRGGELDYWGFIQKVWDMGREVEVVE